MFPSPIARHTSIISPASIMYHGKCYEMNVASNIIFPHVDIVP